MSVQTHIALLINHPFQLLFTVNSLFPFLATYVNNTKVLSNSCFEMSYASIAAKSEADTKSTRLSHDYTEVASIPM